MKDRIWIETKNAGVIAEQLAESPKRMERATRMAANSTVRKLGTSTKRIIASDVGIAQKHLKSRIKFAPARKDSSVTTSGAATAQRDAFARLWIGLNRIAARQIYWGRLKQDSKGAWAKDYFFHDSFIGYRKSKKGPSIYKRAPGTRHVVKHPSRFPIKLQGVEIDSPGLRHNFDTVVTGAEHHYTAEVQRLLRVDWSKVKKGRR